tara:strand:- start:2685 stop:3179 length:495 start_codon:yes stop_codon:yes gene_type:complete
MTNIKKKTIHAIVPGFSLIELIIVIVLVGIFSAIAMTRTDIGLSTIREQIAIDQITSDIDLTRSMAFGKHDTLTIVFSSSQETYTIYSGPDHSRSPLTDFPNSVNGVMSLDNSTMRDVDLRSVDFNGTSELQFLPLGDLKFGGTIALNTKTISVQPVTGKWSVE